MAPTQLGNAGGAAAAPAQGATSGAALDATANTTGDSSAGQPWDVPAMRLLMPGDSLATIEAARAHGPLAAAGSEAVSTDAAAGAPASLVGRRRLRGVQPE